MQELNKYLGNTGKPLLGKEVWKLKQAWREVFASGLKADTGKWTLGGVDWHVFSFDHFPSVKGLDAQDRFNARLVEAFYVTSSANSLKDHALLFPASDDRKQIDLLAFLETHPHYHDLYVVGETMDWTMVFTHEREFDRIYAEI